jgi:hypothetical protein
MMAKGLVLRVVPLLFPCCAGTRRRQAQGRLVRAPRRSGMHDRSYGLSEAQVQAFETKPAPG